MKREEERGGEERRGEERREEGEESLRHSITPYLLVERKWKQMTESKWYFMVIAYKYHIMHRFCSAEAGWGHAKSKYFAFQHNHNFEIRY